VIQLTWLVAPHEQEEEVLTENEPELAAAPGEALPEDRE
jgi:hypothetical protein